MSAGKDERGTPVQPTLADMFSRFLARQAEAQAAGIAAAETGEVVPFEAAPVQPVDARLAWEEAKETAPLFHAVGARRSLKAPGEWANLVAAHEPVASVAFAAGNFPQMVRDLHGLLSVKDLAQLRPNSTRPLSVAGLLEWADEILSRSRFPQALVAIGALRLARQFDAAAERLQKHAQEVPEAWRAAWENERAALAWHQGKAEEAAKLWKKQPDSVPVLFNRGMAALFLGRLDEARSALTKAVAQLPDDSAWHHLGRLYLALAEMRG